MNTHTTSGSIAADSLLGGSGDDILYGQEGNDVLDGAFGADTLFGGDGDDTLTGSPHDIGSLGTIGAPILAHTNYTRNKGWGPYDNTPRAVGDVDGDGRADLIGFGGVTVMSYGQPDGRFHTGTNTASIDSSYSHFGLNEGYTSQNQTPRLVGDVNGDGRDDLVAMGMSNVYTGLGQANGSVANPILAHTKYTRNSGWGPYDNTPRALGDINGDGRDDLVGFGGVTVVSYGQPDGRFYTGTNTASIDSFYSHFGLNEGYTSQNLTPRFVADVNGDGRDDLVAIGMDNVYVGISQSDGTIAAPILASTNYTRNKGWGPYDNTPRALGDIDGDGRADLIGFGTTTVVNFGQADGTFHAGADSFHYDYSYQYFGLNDGYTSQNLTPRFVADVNGDGRDDLIAVGMDNVYVGLAQPGGDHLAGGAGNDVYLVSSHLDTVVEAPNEGTDTVRTDLPSYSLPDNVENLQYIGSTAFLGVGNALANRLTGGAGDDTLDGAAGADTLVGGAGNDVYLVDDPGDRIVEDENGGTDGVRAWTTQYTLDEGLETLRFMGTGPVQGVGNSTGNTIICGGGDDTLDGGGGADTLSGGFGNDVYVVDDVADVVVENPGEGIDEVRTTLASMHIGDGVENLTYIGTDAFTGVGNAADNLIRGGAGADTLNGGLGVDTLSGGAGKDVYIVDDAGDVVVEAAGQGTDEVRTTLASYTLEANVETLTYMGTANFYGVGNARPNTIHGGDGNDSLFGDAGNDTLDGGTGADTLEGGTGSDTYVIDSADDVVVEAAGQGVDVVRSAIDYTLGDNVEQLVLVGAAGVGVGNTLNNALTGTSAANRLEGLDGNDTLDGKGGADTLIGGLGDDTYVIDNPGDVLIEQPGEGIDSVVSSIAHTLQGDFENLTLTGAAAIDGGGNASNNVLIGNGNGNTLFGYDGNDTLDGRAGADTLVGGAGDDSYVVDDTGDLVIEATGEGTDSVMASVSYTLGANVEDLTLAGGADIDATGNSLNNHLTGNSGANRLEGGEGADTIAGGAGNDLYLVDDVGDRVDEAADSGIDEVRTTLSAYTLDANVEILAADGNTAFAGTGNGLDNRVSGGEGADTLDGLSGNDTLDGGGGDDVLVGGTGDDVLSGGDGGDLFVCAPDGGADTIIDFDAAQGDRIALATGMNYTVETDAEGNALVVFSPTASITLIGITSAQVQTGWFLSA